jgi:hypothetical protein
MLNGKPAAVLVVCIGFISGLGSQGVLGAHSGSIRIVPGPVTSDVVVESRGEKICQLVGDYDRERREPTLNLTNQRYGIYSIDLGVPFTHQGLTYVLFGETWTVENPDAIAYSSDDNPEDGLEFDFIQGDDGRFKPVEIPGVSLGTFEVLLEGVSLNDHIYIYASTDNYKYGQGRGYEMGRSVLAFSDDDGQTFTYLYDVSILPDGHFINVSIVEVDLADWSGFPDSSGTGLVIFGSGKYRLSDVALAYQPASQIEDRNYLRYFAGLDNTGAPRWSEDEQQSVMLFHQPVVGELSVTYNPYIRKWIMLYNSCCATETRGINLRTADESWGPWSDVKVVFNPYDDGGYCHFMHTSWTTSVCDSIHDPGRHNESGGEYGPYQYENLATGNDSMTTVYFNMSTWNPYTVVLMKTTLKKVVDSLTVIPEAVDLTEEGTLDWAHWGYGGDVWTDSSQYNHKEGIEPLIDVDTIIVTEQLPTGDPTRALWYDGPTGNEFTWTDGTPVASVHNLDAGIWIPGEGNGFRITVPAGAVRRFLTLYLGTWRADGRLAVSLSDGSAPDVEIMFENISTSANSNVRQYTLEYSAASDNETLAVEWVVDKNYEAIGWGNVTLRAITLSDKLIGQVGGKTGTPTTFRLAQNYPNPFNTGTLIPFTIPAATNGALAVYDITGEKVIVLAKGPWEARRHEAFWDGYDGSGQRVPSGIYIARLVTPEFSESVKMVMLK